MPRQDAVFAVINPGQQWVYSFQKNTWAEPPVVRAKVPFARPYGQVVYCPSYGVLVCPRGGTLILITRPNVGRAKWRWVGRGTKRDGLGKAGILLDRDTLS